MSVNEFQVYRQSTRDINVRYTGNGLAFAVFDLTHLTNEWRDGSSQKHFVRIKTSDKTAENAAKYLGSSLVYIQGCIENTDMKRRRNAAMAWTSQPTPCRT